MNFYYAGGALIAVAIGFILGRNFPTWKKRYKLQVEGALKEVAAWYSESMWVCQSVIETPNSAFLNRRFITLKSRVDEEVISLPCENMKIIEGSKVKLRMRVDSFRGCSRVGIIDYFLLPELETTSESK